MVVEVVDRRGWVVVLALSSLLHAATDALSTVASSAASTVRSPRSDRITRAFFPLEEPLGAHQ